MERAVAQFVGVPVPQIMEDLVDGVQAAPQELVPNRLGEQIGAVPVPQTKEDVECERRDSSDAVYRQDCRSACCDAATGPSNGDKPGDQTCRDSADAVHRQGRRCACCDAATGFDGRQPGDQVETPQTQYTDQVVAVPILIQRQVPQFQTVAKTVEAPAVPFIGRIVDMPAIKQLLRQAPQIQTLAKTVKVPPVPFIGKIVDVPVIKLLMQRQALLNSDCGEDSWKSPPVPFVYRVVQTPVIMLINQVTKHVVTPPLRGDATTGPSGSDSDANGRGPRKRLTKSEYAAMRKAEAMLGIWPSLLTPPSNE